MSIHLLYVRDFDAKVLSKHEANMKFLHYFENITYCKKLTIIN